MQRRCDGLQRKISTEQKGFGSIGATILLFLSVFFLIFVSVSVENHAFAQANTQSLPMTPKLRPDGKKWRFGYYEGGQFPDYEVILKATLRGLMELGWIEKADLPRTNDSVAGGFWKSLDTRLNSKYIEFVSDAYYAAGDFDAEKRKLVREDLLTRLSGKRDVDFMIAMGTWAGQDLANARHNVPSVVMSASDPIRSRIVKSAEDSGFDHLHAKVEPTRYQRQVRLFNDIIAFKKLGIVYEDSEEGRSFAGVDAVNEIAKERGFGIVACFAPFNNVSAAQSRSNAIDCYQRLIGQVDSIYVSVHRGVDNLSVPSIVQIFEKARIPSFSMVGSAHVKQGILMSIAQADFSYVGRFHAETIARILNGAKPRALPQIWEDPAKIAINIRMAKTIGFNPPVDLMLAADETYENYDRPTTARN